MALSDATHPVVEKEMDRLYIDVTAIAAIWMGGLLLLVALLGVIIRHSGVPLLAALVEYRRVGSQAQQSRPVLERIAYLERRIERLEGTRSGSPRVEANASSTPSANRTAGAA